MLSQKRVWRGTRNGKIGGPSDDSDDKGKRSETSGCMGKGWVEGTELYSHEYKVRGL